jgi:hypothetical protein
MDNSGTNGVWQTSSPAMASSVYTVVALGNINYLSIVPYLKTDGLVAMI